MAIPLPPKETLDLAAFLVGRIPKNSMAGKQIRDFIAYGFKTAPKSKAFTAALAELKAQAGTAAIVPVPIIAVMAAGAIGGLAIALTSKKVNADIDKVSRDIVRNSRLSKQQINKLKAQQKGKRAAKSFVQGTGKFSPNK